MKVKVGFANRLLKEALEIFLIKLGFFVVEKDWDVILVDEGFLEGKGKELDKAVLVDTGYSRERILNLVVKHGLRGVFPLDFNPSMLSKALAAVFRGEVWLGNHLVRDTLKSLSTKGVSPLTNREVEVARLVSQGKSNREISQELFISERTVKAHLSKIFQKLGISNRTQLADTFKEMEREGLVPSL